MVPELPRSFRSRAPGATPELSQPSLMFTRQSPADLRRRQVLYPGNVRELTGQLLRMPFNERWQTFLDIRKHNPLLGCYILERVLDSEIPGGNFGRHIKGGLRAGELRQTTLFDHFRWKPPGQVTLFQCGVKRARSS